MTFRDSLNVDSAMAFLGVTPANGMQYIYRTANGASIGNAAANVSMPMPTNLLWLKLQKAGNGCMELSSLDGTSWVQVGSVQTISLNNGGNYLAGLGRCRMAVLREPGIKISAITPTLGCSSALTLAGEIMLLPV